jgi:hypothetical protein
MEGPCRDDRGSMQGQQRVCTRTTEGPYKDNKRTMADLCNDDRVCTTIIEVYAINDGGPHNDDRASVQ